MMFLTAKTLGLLLILSYCGSSLTVFGTSDETEVSWVLAPHHAPAYPPAAAAPSSSHHKGHHYHHHNSPAPSPTKAPVQPSPKTPAHPPTKAPAHPPTKAHAHPPSYSIPTRKLVAVQGVVYCKSCKYPGVATLQGAFPILGAVVKLKCNNTKYPTVVQAKTDKNGYFFILAPKNITTYGSHKCLVSLVSSPMVTCNQPTDMHSGLKGALLIPANILPPVAAPAQAPSAAHPLPFDVFTVGPFAFEPSSKLPCPH